MQLNEPIFWYEWIKVAAFVAGLGVGSIAVFSPAWVWLKFQKLTSPAASLAFVGCALISMSIWQSLQLEGAGFKLIISEIQNLKQTVEKVNDSNHSDTLKLVRAYLSDKTIVNKDALDKIINISLHQSGLTLEQAATISESIKAKLNDLPSEAAYLE